MRRREFITLLGGAAAAPVLWPLAARAQQTGKIARIGAFAGGGRNPITAAAYRAFRDELRRLGFIEGRNLIVDLRPTEQDGVELPTAILLRADEVIE